MLRDLPLIAASVLAGGAVVFGLPLLSGPEAAPTPVAAADRSPAPVPALRVAPLSAARSIAPSLTNARLARLDAQAMGGWTEASLNSPRLSIRATPEAAACTSRTPARAIGGAAGGAVFHECAARPSALPIRR